MLPGMDERVRAIFVAQGGVASARQLREAGVSPSVVARAVRVKAVARMRQDALILRDSLEVATPWERLGLEARAVGLSLAPALPVRGHHAVSHQSSLVLQGLPYFGEGTLVHLSRTDGGRGRKDSTIFVHRPVDERWVTTVDGVRVVVPVMAALQAAASSGLEAGVVCLDGVLHRAELDDLAAIGQVGGRRLDGPAVAAVRAEIAEALEVGFGPADRLVRTVVELADGGAASVGESRTRVALHGMGVGPFSTQFAVRERGVLLGYGDIKLSRWRVIVEFDGRVKYVHDGALFAEKLREDQIRDVGYEFARTSWDDLSHPVRLRHRVLSAIARAEQAEARGA